MERHLRESESEQKARFIKNVSMESLSQIAKTNDKLREMLMSSNFIDINREDINKKYVDSVRKAALDSGFNTMMDSLFNMGSLTGENKELIKSKQKELRELYNQYYDDPKFLADKIADIIDPANAALRKAIQDAADTTMEADKAAVKFTKSMVGFGDIVNKLSSQNYSIKDVLANNLKLPEVDFFKKQIQQNLGVSDFNIIQPYLEQFAINMKSGMSEADIKAELAYNKKRGLHGGIDANLHASIEVYFGPKREQKFESGKVKEYYNGFYEKNLYNNQFMRKLSKKNNHMRRISFNYHRVF
jgi:hypothetical protein